MFIEHKCVIGSFAITGMNLADCCCQWFYFSLCLFCGPLALRLNFEKDSFLAIAEKKSTSIYYLTFSSTFLIFASPSTAQRQFDDSLWRHSSPSRPHRLQYQHNTLPFFLRFPLSNPIAALLCVTQGMSSSRSSIRRRMSTEEIVAFCFSPFSFFCFVYLFACLHYQCQGWTLKSFVDCLLRLISLIADSHQWPPD